jgi:hypothetical protein
MHSVKNTAIAMILLGVSFTLYHISLQPVEEGKSAENGGGWLSGFDISRGPQPVPQGVTTKSRLVDEPGISAGMESPFDSSFSVPPLSAGQPSAAPIQSGPPAYPVNAGNPSTVQQSVPGYQSRASIPAASSDDLVIRQRSELSRDDGLISALKDQVEIQGGGGFEFGDNPLPPSTGFVAEPAAGGDFGYQPRQLPMNQQGSNSGTTGNPQRRGLEAYPAEGRSFDSPAGSDFPATGNVSSIGTTMMSDAESTRQVSASGQPIASGETELGFFQPNHSAPSSELKLESLTFASVWQQVDQWVAAGEFQLALRALSQFYNDTTLSGPQRQRLVGWLDALAAKVIFSSEDHLTGRPYLATERDTLETLAATWQIPLELITNINQEMIGNPVRSLAGLRLKQINGPFNAELKLDTKVITLFVDGLYAGRFGVTLGTSGDLQPGEYEVVLKSAKGYTWRDAEGRDYPPGTPENGYGPHWMGLTGSLCIHAVPEKTQDGHRGCIGLSNQDAADLFVILSEGSVLRIVP